MIFGHAQKAEGALALELYAGMHREGVQPSDRTLVAAWKACTSLAPMEDRKQAGGRVAKVRYLEKGKAIHFDAVKNGFESNVFVANTLVDMYVKCGSMDDARHVF